MVKLIGDTRLCMPGISNNLIQQIARMRTNRRSLVGALDRKNLSQTQYQFKILHTYLTSLLGPQPLVLNMLLHCTDRRRLLLLLIFNLHLEMEVICLKPHLHMSSGPYGGFEKHSSTFYNSDDFGPYGGCTAGLYGNPTGYGTTHTLYRYPDCNSYPHAAYGSTNISEESQFQQTAHEFEILVETKSQCNVNTHLIVEEVEENGTKEETFPLKNDKLKTMVAAKNNKDSTHSQVPVVPNSLQEVPIDTLTTVEAVGVGLDVTKLEEMQPTLSLNDPQGAFQVKENELMVIARVHEAFPPASLSNSYSSLEIDVKLPEDSQVVHVVGRDYKTLKRGKKVKRVDHGSSRKAKKKKKKKMGLFDDFSVMEKSSNSTNLIREVQAQLLVSSQENDSGNICILVFAHLGIFFTGAVYPRDKNKVIAAIAEGKCAKPHVEILIGNSLGKFYILQELLLIGCLLQKWIVSPRSRDCCSHLLPNEVHYQLSLINLDLMVLGVFPTVDELPLQRLRIYGAVSKPGAKTITVRDDIRVNVVLWSVIYSLKNVEILVWKRMNKKSDPFEPNDIYKYQIPFAYIEGEAGVSFVKKASRVHKFDSLSSDKEGSIVQDALLLLYVTSIYSVDEVYFKATLAKLSTSFSFSVFGPSVDPNQQVIINGNGHLDKTLMIAKERTSHDIIEQCLQRSLREVPCSYAAKVQSHVVSGRSVAIGDSSLFPFDTGGIANMAELLLCYVVQLCTDARIEEWMIFCDYVQMTRAIVLLYGLIGSDVDVNEIKWMEKKGASEVDKMEVTETLSSIGRPFSYLFFRKYQIVAISREYVNVVLHKVGSDLAIDIHVDICQGDVVNDMMMLIVSKFSLEFAAFSFHLKHSDAHVHTEENKKIDPNARSVEIIYSGQFPFDPGDIITLEDKGVLKGRVMLQDRKEGAITSITWVYPEHEELFIANERVALRKMAISFSPCTLIPLALV